MYCLAYHCLLKTRNEIVQSEWHFIYVLKSGALIFHYSYSVNETLIFAVLYCTSSVSAWDSGKRCCLEIMRSSRKSLSFSCLWCRNANLLFEFRFSSRRKDLMLFVFCVVLNHTVAVNLLGSQPFQQGYLY